MGRQFCINWAAIVEEAKQRRKTQRLTQSRLAEMAGVSTPTLSRFERGEKDMQLSTVIQILTVLGMNDQHNIIFSEQDAYYDPHKELVIFTGHEGKQIIRCAISKETLIDYFSDDPKKDPLKVFQQNHSHIEHEIRRKYLARKFEEDSFILLQSRDLEY